MSTFKIGQRVRMNPASRFNGQDQGRMGTIDRKEGGGWNWNVRWDTGAEYLYNDVDLLPVDESWKENYVNIT